MFICSFVILYEYFLMHEYETYKFVTTCCTKCGRLCATNQIPPSGVFWHSTL